MSESRPPNRTAVRHGKLRRLLGPDCSPAPMAQEKAKIGVLKVLGGCSCGAGWQ